LCGEGKLAALSDAAAEAEVEEKDMQVEPLEKLGEPREQRCDAGWGFVGAFRYRRSDTDVRLFIFGLIVSFMHEFLPYRYLATLQDNNDMTFRNAML
jgi:hypothetical protein